MHLLKGVFSSQNPSKSGLKQAVCSYLINGITPLLIPLESCSNPQKTRQVYESAMKINSFGFWV